MIVVQPGVHVPCEYTVIVFLFDLLGEEGEDFYFTSKSLITLPAATLHVLVVNRVAWSLCLWLRRRVQSSLPNHTIAIWTYELRTTKNYWPTPNSISQLNNYVSISEYKLTTFEWGRSPCTTQIEKCNSNPVKWPHFDSVTLSAFTNNEVKVTIGEM